MPRIKIRACETCKHGENEHSQILGVMNQAMTHCKICDCLHFVWAGSYMEEKRNIPELHPSHYNSHPSGIECITIVQHHNFNVGNIIAYAWRLGLKEGEPSIKDLHKIINYVNFEIQRIKEFEQTKIRLEDK